ncbi:uncharacterized protein LOC124889662 [Capsicum annuum]|uniref:uncharacterized protein LOC124889662 n=1 Tax=Capsicum annuum TaxID=4072 RepID=UPI001FB0ED61|nr:uncharacterized protein LOC124889662 [Capsicum annuum]
MSKKKLVKGNTIEVTHGCSDIVDCAVAEKKDDPRVFTIPCTIGMHVFPKSIYDLGAMINLIPFIIYKNLGLNAPTPTSMQLLMVDRSIKRLVGILFDVLVKVNKFILSADFMVLDCETEQEVPIILGRSFLPFRRAIVDLEMREIKFRVKVDEVTFKVCKMKKQSIELQVMSVVDVEIAEAS